MSPVNQVRKLANFRSALARDRAAEDVRISSNLTAAIPELRTLEKFPRKDVIMKRSH